jgi:hypothetical protein
MEEIKFIHTYMDKNLEPIGWLQYITNSFLGLADLWDEYDSCYIKHENKADL